MGISTTIIPRLIQPRLLEALEDSPAVLVHGPRQCGKTTLARVVGGLLGYRYLTLDDDVLREAAADDPVGFVARLPDRVILDEVQRTPELFTAIKMEIDRRRVPGRFLLTGSTHLLLLPRLADSLAGRMETLRLHPLARVEVERRESEFLDALFGDALSFGPEERLGGALAEHVAGGGFAPALARPAGRRRSSWCLDYVEALVQRDLRDLSRVRHLEILPALATAAAAQTATLFNASDLAAPFEVTRPTIRDYMTLLERVFLVERLPAWHSNRLTRLVKRPKLHYTDTGLAAALLGLDGPALDYDRPRFGQLLETFVLQELRRHASWHGARMTFHHFRDRSGAEADIVIDRGAHGVAGIEVKASATVRSRDFRGLRRLQGALGHRFAAGAVLYDGEAAVPFGDRLSAVPIRALL